ncbi:MAG: DCC1-like thiol-disulfide oxidoreductase family protein [Xenococcaceae cyanobacterium MO_167.B52]|nr:DCC1-like thiol-disulfide oxidoreductase family protein [Xenococcaceae cyanobacterium MO_167.B52]
MQYHVIYDGNCNLCVTFTQLLEKFDQGNIFSYIPMQNESVLAEFGITSEDCNMGMILIDGNQTDRRWQGSNAAEEIANLLPLGNIFITAYRALPGIKDIGDQAYEQIRDNRYNWFGKRENTYNSAYPFGCNTKSCLDTTL